MDIIFTTESGKEFSLVAEETTEESLKMVSTTILTAAKLGDPIASIYNNFMVIPISTRPLALGWSFAGTEYVKGN